MRLFFGIALPDAVRTATGALAQEAAKCIPGRYAPAENHHITLAFLGEVPERRVEEAAAVLEEALSRHPAPRLTLCCLDHFGRAENGILMIRVKSEPALDMLHAQLVHALEKTGLPADPGPFSPHITLARHACVPDILPDCPQAAFTAKHAHVFVSARDSENVLRYTPIYTVSFSE
ncbi:MAG: RNA 2',3'-cyclic phosphodiesterase [Clostridia bacterium]|nr:RNA 2',3'-cyclic phosphodiesterase [Clostridia bacterium]